jgi:hypothetical protein
VDGKNSPPTHRDKAAMNGAQTSLFPAEGTGGVLAVSKLTGRSAQAELAMRPRSDCLALMGGWLTYSV